MSLALLANEETIAPVITREEILKGKAPGTYEVRLLKEAGNSFLTPEKLREIWMEAKHHDVLFDDQIDGKAKPFLHVLSAPNSTWFEVYHIEQNKPVGMLYMNRILPCFDGFGHFAFWDNVGAGRENLILETLRYVMKKYELPRVSTEVPVYQRGTLRMVKRLGFMKEGERRNGVLYKGKWMNQALFGMLREELMPTLQREEMN